MGLASAVAASWPGRAAAAGEAASNDAAGIEWRMASTDAEVDAAFAEARTAGKPLFLYWGAVWCPPCNQVKATVFNRADFIARTRAFVPVYVDGDRPGAQRLGARFRVNGYPTLLLFSPGGTEVTRLPGEVEPTRYTEVMTLGLEARRPAKAVLAAALAKAADLTAAEWRLLAYYSWETDEQQLVPAADLPAVLQRLADLCPAREREASTRLWLKAVAARGRNAATKSSARATPEPRATADRLLVLLKDPAASRRHADVLENDAPAIVKAATAGRDGGPLIVAFDAALRRLQSDASLSRADQLGALDARVEIARLGGTAVPASLQAEVRDAAQRADREITDGYERQAVIPSAAQLLDEAGLGADARRLLQENLAKSHSPYYLMTGLAELEAHHGAKTEALRWHREAWAASVGPATRLQWGARYVRALTELAPADEAAVQDAALRVIDEAAAQPDALYERNARVLRRVGSVLRGWNADGRHAQTWGRFAARVSALCERYPAGDAQRTNCEAVLAAKPGA
jgi:thiol-disulfide isomerase/thioredoxin